MKAFRLAVLSFSIFLTAIYYQRTLFKLRREHPEATADAALSFLLVPIFGYAFWLYPNRYSWWILFITSVGFMIFEPLYYHGPLLYNGHQFVSLTHKTWLTTAIHYTAIGAFVVTLICLLTPGGRTVRATPSKIRERSSEDAA